MTKDGKLDKKEFCIAMHLIKAIQQGQSVPQALPPELQHLVVVV